MIRIFLALFLMAGVAKGEPLTGSALAPFSVPSGQAAVSAAGTDLAGATQLTGNFILITAASAGNTGVKLPSDPGSIGCVYLFNEDGDTTVKVYPPSGSVQLNSETAGASLNLGTDSGAIACKISSTVWNYQ
jgi:hypothetical protein